MEARGVGGEGSSSVIPKDPFSTGWMGRSSYYDPPIDWRSGFRSKPKGFGSVARKEERTVDDPIRRVWRAKEMDWKWLAPTVVAGGRAAAAWDATRHLPKRWKLKRKGDTLSVEVQDLQEGVGMVEDTATSTVEEASKSFHLATSKLFDSMDKDKSGDIDQEELEEFCEANQLPKEYFLEALNGQGKIRLEELMAAREEKEGELREAFNAMDSNKDGTISFSELLAAMKVMNETREDKHPNLPKIAVNKYAIRKFFNAMDADKSGTIDFEEFAVVFNLVQKKHLQDLTPYWSSLSLAFENGVELVAEDPGKKGGNAFGHFVAGFVAGLVSRTFTSPLDVVKARSIVSTAASGTSTLTAIQDIVREDGLTGLFRGNLSRCLQSAPVQALNFYAFAVFKNLLCATFQKTELNDRDLLLAGSLAGASSSMFVYPLDVVAMRITVQKDVYKNMLDALVRITREEGFRSLYKGIVPSVVGVFPYASVTYGANDILQKTLKERNKEEKLGMLTVYMCGCASGWAGMTISYPFEFLRRRMQLDQGQYAYKGMVHAIQTIARTEGIGAFFRGYIPASQRIIPMSGITFLAYELVRRLIESKQT